MNIKTIFIIIISAVVFVSIWIFDKGYALSLLCGAGIGILISKPVKDIFKDINWKIYLSEKENISKRKVELESELEKLKKED
jgi:hypothetical protein